MLALLRSSLPARMGENYNLSEALAFLGRL
jgi:hypothetical protein